VSDTAPTQRSRPAPMPVTVVSTSRLTPTMVRVTFGGLDLQRFRASEFTDSYVKLTFPRPGVEYPEPLDLGKIQASLPQADWPVVRTYTVRAWDATRHQLTIDFVVHGDHGVAGPWAASAQPGDRIFLTGPGGAYAPEKQAWHLLAGDESALPAIASAIDALDPDARGHVLIEVPEPASEIELNVPAKVGLTWVHTGTSKLGSRLVEWVAAVDFPDAEPVQAFVHGEAAFVADLRRHLRVDRKLARDRVSISGYWRAGATEEGWRAAKAEWNAAAEDVERRAGVA
jgi:NADPH-dependent ferric siderophore reductase